MKQILLLLFSFIYLVGFGQLNFDRSNQLLWEISGKNLKSPSYVLGTIHLNSPKLFNFSDSVYYAFCNTEVFSPEVDIHEIYQLYTTPLNYNLLVDASGRIYSRSTFTNMSNYGTNKGHPQFLDAYFFQIATNSNKRVIPLETIDDQLSAFQSIVFSDYQRSSSFSENDLLSVYLTGNLFKLQHIVYQGFTGSNGYETIIIDRNLKMANTIDSIMQTATTFVAVGAGHLPGKYGVLNSLRQKGYSIRPVETSFTQAFEGEKKFFKSNQAYWHKDTLLNFTIRFGVKPLIKQDNCTVRLEARDLGQGNVYILEVEELPRGSYQVNSYLKENFFQPVNASIETRTLNNDTIYEGIVSVEEYGLCWKRIIFHEGYLYKLTCSGSLPFLTSNRPKDFFNGLQFHSNND